MDSTSYKDKTKQFLKEIEGFEPKPYKDSREIDTVGYGFNLTSPDTAGLLNLYGYDRNRLDNEGISEEDASTIKSIMLDKEEEKLRKKLPVFDNLDDDKKSSLLSMFYNSPKLLGPNLQGYIANNDYLNAAREIAVRSNKAKDPGIAKRRLKEAEMFAGNIDDVFTIMSPEEKFELQEIINSTQNENTRKELIDMYGEKLGLKPRPIAFNRLK